jgi:hypothetical protein
MVWHPGYISAKKCPKPTVLYDIDVDQLIIHIKLSTTIPGFSFEITSSKLPCQE